MTQTTFLNELRTNFRLRLGIWLIIAIVSGYILLLLNDYQDKLKREYREVAEHLHKLQDVASQSEWTQRASEMRAVRVKLEGKLWTANSKGLAQANIQAWLDNQIKTLKIANSRLKVEAATETTKYPHLWQVTGQVEGTFNPTSLDSLLLAIAQSSQWLIVERLEVRQTATPRFTLVVTAYFQASSS